MARPLPMAWLAWAGCVAGSALVARLPDDPGSIPTGWLVVLAILGVLAVRGSRVAWAVLVLLNVLLVGSFLLLAMPIGGQLVLFYVLALAALVSLIAVPVLGARTRSTALAG